MPIVFDVYRGVGSSDAPNCVYIDSIEAHILF
jgi:hypothetical protein